MLSSINNNTSGVFVRANRFEVELIASIVYQKQKSPAPQKVRSGLGVCLNLNVVNTNYYTLASIGQKVKDTW